MNVKMDLHTHSIASGHHTVDTVTSLAKKASKIGLDYLGITDHAPKMTGTASVNYFRNLRYADRTLYGVKMLYGVELNVLDENGNVDLDEDVLQGLDFAIAGLHKQTFKPKSKRENTLALVNAMKNRYVIAICHPDDPLYEIDEKTLVLKAKETGTAIELSSVGVSADGYRGYDIARLVNLLLLCKQHGVFITLGSDSHGVEKIGDFRNSLKLLNELDFPYELVLNCDPEKFFDFVRNKRK
ncbi:MAG: PHP domain-containing protein [Clostridia bacterium]|nr:PHP domain-containing protein [Clostridia bacterium]